MRRSSPFLRHNQLTINVAMACKPCSHATMRAATPAKHSKLPGLRVCLLHRGLFMSLRFQHLRTYAREQRRYGVNHSVCTNGMQRVYHALHSIQQWQFDRPNSSSDHRSGLEQLSNRPASGAGRAHLLLAEVNVRLRRLICDRSRQLRERPLAKHDCAGLLPPPWQSVGLFTNI